MSRPIIDTPVSEQVLAEVDRGWAAYKAATEEHGPDDDSDRTVIDAVIYAFVRQGRPFSANSIRPLLPPDVRKCLISRRLIAAQKAGSIRYVGVTPSTLKSTKAARVNVYRPTAGARQQEAA